MSEEDGDVDLGLGTCCACEGTENVRNVMMLDREAPPLTAGWGCLVCALPMKGALTVLCDECLKQDLAPIFIACNKDHKGRVRADSYPITPFAHDLSKHPELKE